MVVTFVVICNTGFYEHRSFHFVIQSYGWPYMSCMVVGTHRQLYIYDAWRNIALLVSNVLLESLYKTIKDLIIKTQAKYCSNFDKYNVEYIMNIIRRSLKSCDKYCLFL